LEYHHLVKRRIGNANVNNFLAHGV
jgi:hypothetical protein